MKTLIDLYYLLKWYLSNEFLFLPYKIPTILVKYLILEHDIIKDKVILNNWDIKYRWIKKSELKKLSEKINRIDLKWEKNNPIISSIYPIILKRNSIKDFIKNFNLFFVSSDWNHRLRCAHENNIKWIWCIIWPHKVDFYSKNELKYLINQYYIMFSKDDVFFENKKIFIINKNNTYPWIDNFKKSYKIDNTQHSLLLYYANFWVIWLEDYIEKSFIDFK